MESKKRGENFTKFAQETKPIECSTGKEHHCRSELVIGINNRVSYSCNEHACDSINIHLQLAQIS